MGQALFRGGDGDGDALPAHVRHAIGIALGDDQGFDLGFAEGNAHQLLQLVAGLLGCGVVGHGLLQKIHGGVPGLLTAEPHGGEVVRCRILIILCRRLKGFVLGHDQQVVAQDLLAVQGIGQGHGGAALGIHPVQVDACADRDQYRSGSDILFPYFHNDSSNHFIFKTEIRSAPSPVTQLTASTTASRTLAESAPWQRITAPRYSGSKT